MVLLLPPWATQKKKYTIPVAHGPRMPQTVLAQPANLTLSGYRMAWAAITSGRPPGLVPSVLTLAGRDYRSWRIWASLGLLEDDGSRRLRRTQDFAALDPTEKGHLNYALAGAIAKAYAAEKLGSPWLAHLSLAQGSGYPLTSTPGYSTRPDYFGITNNGDFFIAEAKGRIVLRKALKSALDAKHQTGAVRHVKNSVVLARYGFAVTANTAGVSLYATDPEEEVQIEVTWEGWLRRYYRMILDLAEAIDQTELEPEGNQSNWQPVRLFVPSMVRQWAKGESSPVTNWSDGEFLSALEYPTGAVQNPDLTAFVRADRDAA
jgi:hypothetical protein